MECSSSIDEEETHYLSTHVSTHMSTHVSTHMSMHMPAHMSTHICSHVCTFVSTHLYTHSYTHVWMYVHPCRSVHIGPGLAVLYTHVYAHVYTHVCTHVYAHVSNKVLALIGEEEAMRQLHRRMSHWVEVVRYSRNLSLTTCP